MKMETWIFGSCTAFFAVVTPIYWFMSYDPTGTSALVMTTLLAGLVTAYLGVHAARMEPRPEDRQDAEIVEGAGELGFFPPYSWWPLWCGLTAATIVFGLAMAAWWLAIVGAVFGLATVAGWVFEYYVGDHAH